MREFDSIGILGINVHDSRIAEAAFLNGFHPDQTGQSYAEFLADSIKDPRFDQLIEHRAKNTLSAHLLTPQTFIVEGIAFLTGRSRMVTIAEESVEEASPTSEQSAVSAS